jgi:hypothetical protein
MAEPSEPLRRGDLCRHGCSTYPVYSVISAHDGRAWVRDISSGAEAIVNVEHCNLLEPEEAQRFQARLRPAEPSSSPPGEEPD